MAEEISKWSQRERLQEEASRFEDALRSVLGQRDALGLQALLAANPGKASFAWIQEVRGNQISTMALPEAARTGWIQGVQALAASGADPNAQDAERGGWSTGRAPLAEAISREDYAMAQALLDAGARFSGLADMLWAPGLVAHRKGLDSGRQAWEWMRARGFEPWANDDLAKSSQSAFLFLGSMSKGSVEQKHAWDMMLFDGAPKGPGLNDCIWTHAFSACKAGAALSPELLEFWFDASGSKVQEVAKSLLAWGLEGLCAEAIQAGASRLTHGWDWKSNGGDSLDKACLEKPAGILRGAPMLPERAIQLEGELFEVFWSSCGEKVSQWPNFVEKAAFHALKSGRFGFFEGIVREASIDPMMLLGHWRANGPSVSERSSSKGFWDRGIAVAIGAAMERSKGGPGDASDAANQAYDGFCAWEDKRRDGHREMMMQMGRMEAGKMLARKMRQEIPEVESGQSRAAPRL